MAPKEVLDRLAVKELRVHVQRPGNKAQGIDDHRFDGIAAGDDPLRSRRNEPVDDLDKSDGINDTGHNAQMVESPDVLRGGVTTHDRGLLNVGRGRKHSLKPESSKSRFMCPVPIRCCDLIIFS